MNKFCFRMGGFILLAFMVFGLCDFVCTKAIRTSKSRAIVVWEDLFNSRIDADLIYLGSSRTCCTYNPEIIDPITGKKSYNLGLHGKSVDMDELRYNLLIKYNNKPHYIVWDIFHSSFCESNGWLDEQFTPYLFEDDLWENLTKENHGFKFSDRYIPMYRYWKRSYIYKYAFYNARCDKNPYKGYIPDKITRKNGHFNDIDSAIIICPTDTTIIRHFCNTISSMKNDGIEVILVYSPFYFKGLSRLKGLDKLLLTCEKIASDYNIDFLNYLNDPMCKDSTLFCDCMHLNQKGAEIFSKKIGLTLDSIINSK